MIINAPRDEIFSIVSDLAGWMKHLPHYREITFLARDGERDIVRMAAVRGSIPCSWTSAYEVVAADYEMRFEHLTKWTKGMKVIWTLMPTRDGTRVEIVHDLKFRVPGLGWFAEPIIGGFFVEHIASQTLATFKKIIEEKHKA